MLCFHTFSQPLLSDQSEKQHLAWFNKLGGKLEKILEFYKEQFNQITKLAFVFQPDLL